MIRARDVPVLATTLVALAACGGAGGGGETPSPAPEGPVPSPVPQEVADRIEEEARGEPPEALPMDPVRFPSFVERTLSNGARVIVVEQAEQPFVTVNLLIRSGATSDGRDRAGVASFTAQLLDKGTGTRSAREIAEAVDFIGASLGASASADWTSVTLGALTGDLDTGLDLLADVVRNPTFPGEELEIVRTRTLSSLRVQRSQPGALASRRFTADVYGRHPYGKQETPESVGRIDRGSIERFHRDHYRPSNALFVVAGDVGADEIARRLEERFGGWRDSRVSEPTYFAPPERERREIVLVHKPGSVQSVIRAGHVLVDGRSDAWIPLRVATRIVGGGSQGRLFQLLREDRGWTYGAYAGTSRRFDTGVFQMRVEARNEVTDSVVSELIEQLDRLRSEPVPPDELDAAKDYLVGSFPLTIETPQQIAGQVAETRLLGLPGDHLETYRDRVAAVTSDDVLAAAREHFHPDRLLIVVVGDATEIRSKLTPYGTVRMYDVDGGRISAADLEVRGSEMTFDPRDLPLGSYTYRVVAGGTAAGEIMRTLDRAAREGRAVVVARTSASLGPRSIRSEVTFTREGFEPVESSFRVSAMGQEASSRLRYEGGVITGTRTSPDRGESEVEIDAVPGTLMGDMQELAVWLADLEPGAEFELPVVDELNAKLKTVSVSVGEPRSVEVPAGTFEAYRVEVDADQTQVLWARVEPPHIVVKVETGGGQVAFELESYPGGGEDGGDAGSR